MREIHARPCSLLSRAALGAALAADLFAPALVPADVLFDNNNKDAVSSGPSQETVVDLKTPALISRIFTYHWNDGRGAAKAGSITLRSAAGETLGPWDVESSPGQGGVPNANWECFPNVSVPAGRYSVLDSDPSTWSWNARTGGAGVVTVEGWPQ
jgi:hypothetical protein